MIAGSKSQHFDRELPVPAPTSNPTTTTPILLQLCQSTGCSSYPYVVPTYHTAQAYVDAYLEAAGIGEDRRGPLFRSCEPGRRDALQDRAMSRLSALKMIKRRARQAGLPAEICAHSFRGTGITEYLRNGGDLEVAARIAGHESTRTTQLYNRLNEEISLDEIERIHI